MKPSSARHVESWHGLAARPRSLASVEDERPVSPRRENLLFILKAGPGGARALVLLTPAGFEQMFQEGSVPAHDTTTPPVEDYDVQQVAELAAHSTAWTSSARR